MSLELSAAIKTRTKSMVNFEVKSLPLDGVQDYASPILVFDDFTVSGQPFDAHPHAGFSAVTYVFRDSRARLRSRDSLGGDIVVGPGGMVWTQAGRGVMHEEVSAEAQRPLHGVQFFVNLSARNKLSDPKVLFVRPQDVPEWRSTTDDVVRVVVGAFGGLSSSLQPLEPFTLLDICLRKKVDLALEAGRHGLVYVVMGSARISSGGETTRTVDAGSAVFLRGAGAFSLEAPKEAELLYLSGKAISEPVVQYGPFVMNDQDGIKSAIARYHAGQMGTLASGAER